MSYERHYYTRPRLIPPAIPISLLLASALYLAGQFVEIPSVSGLYGGPPPGLPVVSGNSGPNTAGAAPSTTGTVSVATDRRTDPRTVQAAYLRHK